MRKHMCAGINLFLGSTRAISSSVGCAAGMEGRAVHSKCRRIAEDKSLCSDVRPTVENAAGQERWTKTLETVP